MIVIQKTLQPNYKEYSSVESTEGIRLESKTPTALNESVDSDFELLC